MCQKRPQKNTCLRNLFMDPEKKMKINFFWNKKWKSILSKEKGDEEINRGKKMYITKQKFTTRKYRFLRVFSIFFKAYITNKRRKINLEDLELTIKQIRFHS